MADRRKLPTKKNSRPSSSTNPRSRGNNLNGWISVEEKHREFTLFWKERKLISPKYFDLNWFHIYGFQFPPLIFHQGIQSLLEMQGKFYSDLVRVFYFNLKVRDGVYSTRVKGVDIVLDDDIWTTMAQIQLNEDVVMLI
ncbi:hypothetical protein LR48_Vigan09g000300 [Vigna angularis]|uniref:Uncharacterized protein n=1 Tax=Phaseolus angularis TaxID=3914 RepID=A0A0L9V9M4_PHAAN|nr:hypothetical protein LR48_Vigan09g000300 [Vigna angularis]